MDFLPVEILEIVFLPLSKNEDIEKCFNINSKWRQIIGNMFANKCKYTCALLLPMHYQHIISTFSKNFG